MVHQGVIFEQVCHIESGRDWHVFWEFNHVGIIINFLRFEKDHISYFAVYCNCWLENNSYVNRPSLNHLLGIFCPQCSFIFHWLVPSCFVLLLVPFRSFQPYFQLLCLAQEISEEGLSQEHAWEVEYRLFQKGSFPLNCYSSYWRQTPLAEDFNPISFVYHLKCIVPCCLVFSWSLQFGHQFLGGKCYNTWEWFQTSSIEWSRNN